MVNTTPIILKSTSEEGNNQGRLHTLSKWVSKVTLKRKMLERMMENKVASFKIEGMAYRNIMEAKGQSNKANWGEILSNREWPKVRDILELKIKYCKDIEEEAREEYKREKKKVREKFKKNKQMMKYDKLIARIGKQISRRWTTETERIREKVERLCKKIHNSERYRESERGSKENWLLRMADGSGTDRHRYTVEVLVLGDVSMDEDEHNAASLPPKFTTFPKVTIEDAKVQTLVADSKSRWGRSDKLMEAGDIVVENEQLSDEDIVKEYSHLEVFDPDSKSIDFRKLRPTQIKNNPRVHMAKARPVLEEANYAVRGEKVRVITEHHIEERIKTDNMTDSERRGMKKLQKRMKQSEIVILRADKSGKFCRASMEAYCTMGDKHTASDTVVTWKDFEAAQRQIQGHLKGLNRVFNTGENHGEKGMERAWAAKELESSSIPGLSILVKDHKKRGADGLFPTRPVCGANRSPNGELSEWISDIIDAAIEVRGTSESISTEDLLSLIDSMAGKIRDDNLEMDDLFIGSLDVEALYPSLEINQCSKLCGEMVSESGLKFEGVDWVWVAKYVALCWTREEVNRRELGELVPYKKSKRGFKPTLLTVSIDDKKERWRFGKTPDKYTSEDKKQLMQALVEITVSATFANHFYKWKGQIYKQEAGGPTGLRGTGSCAKISMDKWLEIFKQKLDDNNVKVYILTKYVDDILLVTQNFKLGSYWNGSKVVHSKSIGARHRKSGISRSKLTLDIFKQIADSIFQFLRFTGEVSEDGNPIACLDSQIWGGRQDSNGRWYEEKDAPGLDSEIGRGGVSVMYKFYKKPMASKFTILSRSAVPEQSKVSTAVSEYRRRWKNTSPWCSSEIFEGITKEYSDNLAAMGYSKKWRYNAILSTLEGYKKYSNCMEGSRNRPGHSTAIARRSKNLAGKRTWFKDRVKENIGGHCVNVKGHQKQTQSKTQGPDFEIETPFFIPHTPGGILRSRLSKMEEELGLKGCYKYVETLGPTVGDLLVRADPWREACGRLTCLPCITSPGQCNKQGVVYCITCITCKLEGQICEYWGETARTSTDRGAEHMRDIRSRNENSPLIEHWLERHANGDEGPEPSFNMKVIKSFRSPLERQCFEGHKINSFSGHILMNRKGEWGTNLPPRMIMEEELKSEGQIQQQGQERKRRGAPNPSYSDAHGRHKRSKRDDSPPLLIRKSGQIRVKSQAKLNQFQCQKRNLKCQYQAKLSLLTHNKMLVILQII